MINQKILRQRVIDFINEFDIPVSKFVNRVSISRSAYYRWLAEEFEFSEATAGRINEHLKNYGY